MRLAYFRRYAVACLPLMLALVACETTETSGKTASTSERVRSTVPLSVSTEAPDPGAIKTYSVPAGHCGMILWAMAGGEPVPVFLGIDEGTAEMEIDGKMTRLARQSGSGRSRAGMPQNQLYQSLGGDGVTVEINTVWGRNFPSGSYVERGTITLSGADGWQRVLPVAGIAGCKP